MDQLIVKTQARDDGAFVTDWQIWLEGAKQPRAGSLTIRLDEVYGQDRPIIAELGAIHHLLEVRRVRGDNRLGDGLRIEVSFGAIRKALLKGALKRSDHGDTNKAHVAGCSTFLATKYFEADIVVRRKWREVEPKSFERDEVIIPASFPRPAIFCHPLGEEVVITRHAMRRYIGRIDKSNPYRPKLINEDDLSAVPDKLWGTAWRWFRNIFQENSKLRRVRVLPQWHARYLKRYGPGVYLWHPDSQAVIIVTRDHGQLVAATVVHDECAAIEKGLVQVGQRLVQAQELKMYAGHRAF